MSGRHRFTVSLWLFASMLLGVGPASAWVVVPPRAGQVGIGIQGQYGMLLESGNFGKDFGSGGGLTVRLRYRLRYERAIGLSFESHNFESRVAIPAGAVGDTMPERFQIFTAGPEIYQLFGTRTHTHRMLSAGAGLAKIDVKLRDGETAFPTGGDGLYLSAGAGLEHFFWQSWALDFSGRYFAVFQDGNVDHDFQAAAGLIFYASY